MDLIIYWKLFCNIFQLLYNPNTTWWYRNLYNTFQQCKESYTSESRSEISGKFLKYGAGEGWTSLGMIIEK